MAAGKDASKLHNFISITNPLCHCCSCFLALHALHLTTSLIDLVRYTAVQEEIRQMCFSHSLGAVIITVTNYGGGGGGGGAGAPEPSPIPTPMKGEEGMEWPCISCHLFYLVSQKYPKHAYLDSFNKVLRNMKKSIVGSVDGLCDEAISQKMMTHEEKAGILADNKYGQASRFLDSLAPKIEVDPQVLALLMNMLSGLRLRTCDQVVCKWF